MKYYLLIILIVLVPTITLGQSTNTDSPSAFAGSGTSNELEKYGTINPNSSPIEPQGVNQSALAESFYFQKLFRSMQTNPGVIASSLGLEIPQLADVYVLLLAAENEDKRLNQLAKSSMCSSWLSSDGTLLDAISAIDTHRNIEVSNTSGKVI